MTNFSFKDAAGLTQTAGAASVSGALYTQVQIVDSTSQNTAAVGAAGEVTVSNAPLNKWWQSQTSVMYGTSVQAIAPQGASVFTYVTGLQIVNDSPNYSRVKITGGLGSVLSWTVAPGAGGSNITFINPIKTGANSGVSASISGVSSVYISIQGFTSNT